MRHDITTLEQLEEFAHTLASSILPGQVLALHGELGAGKTTFTQYLLKALGSDVVVRSPTFTILHQYEWKDNTQILHLDLYRLKTTQELENIGFPEMVQAKDVLLIIEWPELAQSVLPPDTIHLSFHKDLSGKRFIERV